MPCIVNTIPTFCGLTSNAGKARFRGVEVETSMRAAEDFIARGDRFHVSGTLGYLDAKFKEFLSVVAIDEVTGLPIAPVEVDLADYRKVQNTPKWTASGTLDYTVPAGTGQLNFNTTVSYRSASQRFEHSIPGLDQGAFALWDANLIWRSAGRRWTLGLHGKNLTNKRYITGGYNFFLQNPYTGQFILANGTPGLSSAVGLEGVLTGFSAIRARCSCRPGCGSDQSGTVSRMISYAERRWTSSDGLSLFARDYPGDSGLARLPVICLHGLTRNSSDFEDVAPFIAALGRRYRARRQGTRPVPVGREPEQHVPRTYARDVKEMLDALGISRAVFIGTSMGGIIIMLLAAWHRARIAAAVLNDAGPQVSPEGIARIQSYAGKHVELNNWADAVAYVRRVNQAALPHLSDGEWERLTNSRSSAVKTVRQLSMMWGFRRR